VITWRRGARPLLVVLEDLQWMDLLSRDLLEALIRRTDGLPILFLLSYRPVGGRTPEALADLPSFEEMRLGDLETQAMHDVVAAKAGQAFGTGVPLSDALVELVLGRAQGNPFYAEELVNYVRRLGVDPPDAAAVDALDLPDSMQAVVLSRIDGLDEHPRQGLKVGSTRG
jgi:predicted ATPase